MRTVFESPAAAERAYKLQFEDVNHVGSYNSYQAWHRRLRQARRRAIRALGLQLHR